LIYDDDEQTWNQFLDRLVKNFKGKPYHFDFSAYTEALSQAFTNKHSKAKHYYDAFIEAGFPKEKLGDIPL
jgi:hypothetical protein